MSNITVTTSQLPTNIEDLSKFVLIGREKLVAVRAEIRAIEKVGLAREPIWNLWTAVSRSRSNRS